MAPSKGTCEICNTTLNKALMLPHLASCAGTSASEVIQLRVEGARARHYWLDLDVKADATLEALDDFLRRTWLECCGHLSSFTIGKGRYSSLLDDFEVDPGEKTLNHPFGRALGRQTRFAYEYDFGSTTELVVTVTGRGGAAPRPDAVRLLARNTPPSLTCSHDGCDARATSICSICVWEGEALACTKHARRHTCGEAEAWLPVVNSPRMGVCGFTGETAPL